MLVNNSFLLAIFGQYRFGNNFDGPVGTIELANSATGAGMLIVFIMGHDQLTAETLRQYEFFTILGILLGNVSPWSKEVLGCNFHTGQQGPDTLENLSYIGKE